jgi:hypothetical protein
VNTLADWIRNERELARAACLRHITQQQEARAQSIKLEKDIFLRSGLSAEWAAQNGVTVVERA